ncbi:MAG: hypothetical protein D6795_05980 [Deltaproteobacteria bacterium]|nr:MAG: hypothetical protein D6795_05980 [Deltaproteobacteria bacterium]
MFDPLRPERRGLHSGQGLHVGMKGRSVVFSEREKEIVWGIVAPAMPGHPEQRAQFERAVGEMEGMLTSADRSVRLAVRLLLHVFDQSARLASWRLCAFVRLSPARQERYVVSWSRSRFYAKRMAIRAVMMLFMVHFYADPDVKGALGFLERRPIPPWPEAMR